MMGMMFFHRHCPNISVGATETRASRPHGTSTYRNEIFRWDGVFCPCHVGANHYSPNTPAHSIRPSSFAQHTPAHSIHPGIGKTPLLFQRNPPVGTKGMKGMCKFRVHEVEQEVAEFFGDLAYSGRVAPVRVRAQFAVHEYVP